MEDLSIEKSQEVGLIADFPSALLRWYPFRKGTRALYVGDETDALYRMLRQDKEFSDIVAIPRKNEILGGFDYIVCTQEIEKRRNPEELLREFSHILKKDGILLLSVNNRLGIRYFCGDKDCYTGRVFDGLEDYRCVYPHAEDFFWGRMYDRSQWEQMLNRTGFEWNKFYSVFPGLENPSFIYADGFVPNEDLNCRIFPEYSSPGTVFMEESSLYRGLIDNKLFSYMANAFLVECVASAEVSFSDVLHVTSSYARGKRRALLTVIHDNDTVTKEAVYPEGRGQLKSIIKNSKLLNDRGIKTVPMDLKDEVLTMPFVHAETGQSYLKRLLKEDQEKFLVEFDRFRDIIKQSSDSYMAPFISELAEEVDEKQPVLLMKRAFLDLVPLNSFYINDEYVFYDQEFCVENYPFNVLLDRLIATFYAGNSEMEKYLLRDDMQERYGILKDKIRWQRLEWKFIRTIRNDDILSGYYSKKRADWKKIYENRELIDHINGPWGVYYRQIFKGAHGKKIYLFGAGNYAELFLAEFADYFSISGILDNNSSKWGTSIRGIKVFPPHILEDEKSPFRVYLCIKNNRDASEQLAQMGVTDVVVFKPRENQ